MDSLYVAISDLLDALLPTAILADFQGLNDLMAYVLTLGLIYGVILRPVLKLTGIIKK